ncbi:replication initiator protein [Blackfly microvirus SF02]|uniref:Replication initiator protein n=1 Tax=Blackfly microvirus SF02 TaxID=2576452 RepID=A0A4P8PS13_9VIRU|nr:replication initiator protein [Blackfly microvirus SF02]
MSCFTPLDGYRVKGGSVVIVARGDRPPRNALTRVPLSIPCGGCQGCRLEKSRQWAMRCMHEARMSSVSSFVTLTYDNDHLPPGGSLSPTALRYFMGKLRKKREAGVRFYGCGEYGEVNMRPHYHVLLFNCDFPDKKFHSRNGRNEPLYTSDELRVLWPFGFNLIGAVTYESAAYVARYVMKKVNGKKADDHYAVYDANGQIFDRYPEFARMSRMPGVGAGYYEKYGGEVRAHDTIIVNGKEVKPPRYYDKKHEAASCKGADGLLCKCTFCSLKRKRKRLAVLHKADNTPERLRVKEVIALAKMKNSPRKV